MNIPVYTSILVYTFVYMCIFHTHTCIYMIDQSAGYMGLVCVIGHGRAAIWQPGCSLAVARLQPGCPGSAQLVTRPHPGSSELQPGCGQASPGSGQVACLGPLRPGCRNRAWYRACIKGGILAGTNRHWPRLCQPLTSLNQPKPAWTSLDQPKPA